MSRTKKNRRRMMSASTNRTATRRSGIADPVGLMLAAVCVTPPGTASPDESCAAFAGAFLAVFPDGFPFRRQSFRIGLSPRNATCVRVGEVAAFVDVTVLDDRIRFAYSEVPYGLFRPEPARRSAELVVPTRARAEACEGAAHLRRM